MPAVGAMDPAVIKSVSWVLSGRECFSYMHKKNIDIVGTRLRS